jgi:hypothetical protein
MRGSLVSREVADRFVEALRKPRTAMWAKLCSAENLCATGGPERCKLTR